MTSISKSNGLYFLLAWVLRREGRESVGEGGVSFVTWSYCLETWVATFWPDFCQKPCLASARVEAELTDALLWPTAPSQLLGALPRLPPVCERSSPAGGGTILYSPSCLCPPVSSIAKVAMNSVPRMVRRFSLIFSFRLFL